jgi:hypothetical protein
MTITLRTLMLRTLSQGRPITAGAMSRLWGEDRRRCQDWLEKFAKIGVVKVRKVKPQGRRRASNRDTTQLYVPQMKAVMDELAKVL